MYHEIETNVAEVSEVGGAFVMLKRDVAQKISNAHPELMFKSENDAEDYAVFDPIILPTGRRLSEDYAFCYRLRKLGVKIEILLDVTLKHVGMHVFEGNLLEHLVMQDPTFNEVENEK
jgi:hypothetical protein